MPGPLHGVKVVEFSEIIAGPLAGMLLSDMGAEVIKVEPPWGDPWRYVQSFLPGEGRPFMAYNRGKRSLPINLAKPEARDILGRLVPGTDVVLVNYRPDVVAQLGLDYETLSQLNPRLVYCDLTAFGRRGPDSHRPGYDIVLQAITGMMAAEDKLEEGTEGVPQHIWSTPLIDTNAGFCLTWCVCAALFARERTGQGQRIESTLLGSALTLMGMRFLQVESLDQEARSLTLETLSAFRDASAPYKEILTHYQSSHPLPPGNIYYRVYMTQDGAIAVGCLSDPLRQRLLEILSLYDIRFEPDYDPNSVASQTFGSKLISDAEAVFRTKNVGQWLEILEKRGIPAGPVHFIEELVDDPQVLANGLQIEVEHRDAGRVKMVGPLARFNGATPSASLPSPALGEHALEILQELGFSDAEIQGWLSSGIVGS